MEEQKKATAENTQEVSSSQSIDNANEVKSTQEQKPQPKKKIPKRSKTSEHF